jgi:hypothetical protein
MVDKEITLIENSTREDVKDSGIIHFESLCSMVDQLQDQLPVNDANYLRRDYCSRCEYFYLDYYYI